MLTVAALLFAGMTETAIPARAFVDSVGVNLHLHYNGTAYYDDFPAIERLLSAAHIRHVRDGLIDTTWQPYYDRLSELGSSGIHSTLVTNVKESLPTIVRYAKRIPVSLEAIEAPNEYDRSGDPGWAATLVPFVKALYAGLKADPATARLSVIGPSLTSAAAFGAVGDLSASLDSGNVHDYFGGFNPGTSGYGGAGFGSHYGSIEYNRNVAAQASRSHPIVSTETGYGTAAATHANVSEEVQGKYVPRLLLEHYLHGIQRTFVYQLVDEGTDGFGAYGLLHTTLAPKPAFRAVSALLNLLDVPGAERRDALRYEIADVPNLAHALFEKPDGTFALAYWLETASWDVNAPNGGAPIAVPPQRVTLHFAKRMDAVMVYQARPNGSLAGLPKASANELELEATDAVNVVCFRPT